MTYRLVVSVQGNAEPLVGQATEYSAKGLRKMTAALEALLDAGGTFSLDMDHGVAVIPSHVISHIQLLEEKNTAAGFAR